MTRIKLVEHFEATSRLKEIYDDLVKKGAISRST